MIDEGGKEKDCERRVEVEGRENESKMGRSEKRRGEKWIGDRDGEEEGSK